MFLLFFNYITRW